MDADLKDRWVKALRSGQYKQGRNVLYRESLGEYCCLGVLCAVNGATLDELDLECTTNIKRWVNSELSEEVCSHLGDTLNDAEKERSPRLPTTSKRTFSHNFCERRLEMTDMPALTNTTTVYASTIQSTTTLVSISPDGRAVCIDWPEVERQAQGHDPYLAPLSKALIAARDGTYQPMPKP